MNYRKEINMKRKLLILTSIFFIQGCVNPSTSDSGANLNSSSLSESLSSVEDSSSMIDSSSEENSSITSSDSISGSEEVSSDINVDISDKMYYKNLVNRDKLVYSDDFKNDENHDVTALEIFQLNDTHGAYINQDDIVGISKVKTCINQNTIDPYAVVKIANGDMLQGTAFSNMLLGEPAISALNEMDFDCFVLGNHEFDWGIDNLSIYKDNDLSNGELQCDFLGANIVDGSGKMPDWIKPYTVVKKGDVKVGIIGVIGENLESSISKASLGNYQFLQVAPIIKEYTNVLLNQENVDVIILSEHNHSSNSNQSYVNTNMIDCIINGHDHKQVEDTVNRFDGKTIPVIESYDKNGSIGKVTLNLDSSNKMTSFSMKHLTPSSYQEDTTLKTLMDVFYEVVSAYESEVIGYTSSNLNNKSIGISTCNYINYKYGVDVTMINTAGVRANVPVGDITNGSMYEVFPFDNELYIIDVTGDELYSIVSRTGYYFNDTGIGNGSNCNLSNIDRSKMYKLCTVDYVATKSFFSMYFNEEHDLIKTGDYIRDCAIENIKMNYKKK